MKIFKTQSRSSSLLNKTVILLNDVIEIFDLSDLNFLFFRDIFVKKIKCCLVASAFINGDFIRPSVFLKGLPKKGLGSASVSLSSQKEINSIAFFINGPIKIYPFAVQLDLGPVHPPASIHRLLTLTYTFID